MGRVALNVLADAPTRGRAAARRDFNALSRRRGQAAALFAEGAGPVEVAAQLEVSIQAASGWRRRWQQEGEAGLAGAGRAGRLTAADRGADPGRRGDGDLGVTILTKH